MTSNGPRKDCAKFPLSCPAGNGCPQYGELDSIEVSMKRERVVGKYGWETVRRFKPGHDASDGIILGYFLPKAYVSELACKIHSGLKCSDVGCGCLHSEYAKYFKSALAKDKIIKKLERDISGLKKKLKISKRS